MRAIANSIDIIRLHLDQIETNVVPTGALNERNMAAVASTIRRSRDKMFPRGYFADAGWEILIDLHRAHTSGERLAIGDLGLSAEIPGTTVLRYVEKFVEDGFVERQPDPHDRRRIFIQLSPLGLAKMEGLFREAAVKLGVEDKSTTQTSKANGSSHPEFPGNSVFR
ncbi:MAG: MarR family transcriptional regulator [Sphingopyxis sp.]